MRTMERTRAGRLVGALGVAVLLAGTAHAVVLHTSTERPGSILIFPKVVRAGNRDTVIQISNTGNLLDSIRCFYLDSDTCESRDFFLTLTKQQPTIWRVGEGRKVQSGSGDPFPGLDPGNIPAQPVGFTGALVCVEVEASDDMPLPMDKLKGEATLEPSPAAIAAKNQEYSKYNAVALEGATDQGAGDNILDLDGSEYASCPTASVINFIPDGLTSDPIEQFGNGGTCIDSTVTPHVDTGVGCNNDTQCTKGPCSNSALGGGPGKSRVSTVVTIIPCDLDFQNATPAVVNVTVTGSDDMERNFSTSHPIACWGSFPIGSALKGSLFATARLTTAPGQSPILGVAESFFSDSLQNTGSAAVNLHMEGADKSGTTISLSILQ